MSASFKMDGLNIAIGNISSHQRFFKPGEQQEPRRSQDHEETKSKQKDQASSNSETKQNIYIQQNIFQYKKSQDVRLSLTS